MTKTELAKHVAAAAGLTGDQARSAVDAVFDTIADELAGGGDVAIAVFRESGLSASLPQRQAVPGVSGFVL